MSEPFPQWGWWIFGLSNPTNHTHTRHLFIDDEQTACGWSPKKHESDSIWYRFTSVPRVDGLTSIWFEMHKKRTLQPSDFPKCKRCIKSEEKGKKK